MIAMDAVARARGAFQSRWVISDEVRTLVDSIDLSMVKMKLMDPKEGQGWSQDVADLIEKRYRRYLCMTMVDSELSNVPTADIDTFWHQHILDTRAYARDCERVFGEFLHHFPYFGMRGEDDAKELTRSFEDTASRYRAYFGEEYTLAKANGAGKCKPNDCTGSVCKGGCLGKSCKSGCPSCK